MAVEREQLPNFLAVCMILYVETFLAVGEKILAGSRASNRQNPHQWRHLPPAMNNPVCHHRQFVVMDVVMSRIKNPDSIL